MVDLEDRVALLPSYRDEGSPKLKKRHGYRWPRGSRNYSSRGDSCRRVLAFAVVVVFGLVLLWHLITSLFRPHSHSSTRGGERCATVNYGYRCFTEQSRSWGQYSPFFSLASVSELSPDVPAACTITFAQILSRHGARFPTAKKSGAYEELVGRIQRTTSSYRGDFAFLEHFKYEMGAEDMTAFGEEQLIHSGARFYERYRDLARSAAPFIRASGSDRVIASAEKFIQGFQDSKKADGGSTNDDLKDRADLIIPEGDFNNTLDHGACARFEADKSAHEVQSGFLDTFATPIVNRVNEHLVGANLAAKDILFLMDMCPFHTIAATPDASILSPFCSLFTRKEWEYYDYYQSLGKYYGYGAGNPLGASQGIGFANELIARLTNTPVKDSTNVNHTLDSDPATFPLALPLYADFSHDNTMISIYTALGLYNSTAPLSKTTLQSVKEMNGYSASWTVPFGAMAYIEKMKCDSEPNPLVRVLVNDRVVPLHGCPVDALGRCTVGDFVKGLSYARAGGDWSQCPI